MDAKPAVFTVTELHSVPAGHGTCTILLSPMAILLPSDPVAQSRNKDSERCEISMLIFLE